jgi:hypothetical protein
LRGLRDGSEQPAGVEWEGKPFVVAASCVRKAGAAGLAFPFSGELGLEVVLQYRVTNRAEIETLEEKDGSV